MNKEIWGKRADIVEARLAHLRRSVKPWTSVRRILAVLCVGLFIVATLLIGYVFVSVDLA